jgi:hypothetical protein
MGIGPCVLGWLVGMGKGAFVWMIGVIGLGF